MDSIEHTMNRVTGILETSAGQDYIGEPVSQLEHALQCAHFARGAGADDETVIAALLHDVGHLLSEDLPSMDGLGVVDHERAGAEFLLALGFSGRVARLVGGHVEAKRYLTFKHPRYRARLSAASIGTLNWQGGPMNADEAEVFESSPEFDSILALRQWDEMAKEPDLECAGLDAYRELLRAHLHRFSDSPC